MDTQSETRELQRNSRPPLRTSTSSAAKAEGDIIKIIRSNPDDCTTEGIHPIMDGGVSHGVLPNADSTHPRRMASDPAGRSGDYFSFGCGHRDDAIEILDIVLVIRKIPLVSQLCDYWRMTVAEFKEFIANEDAKRVAEVIFLTDGADRVSEGNISLIRTKLAAATGVSGADIEVRIVGSAKLGFSIVEKTVADELLPRYREFGPDSDIDVAVISPPIFQRIWDAIGAYSHNSLYFPWTSNRLGDYLVCGWLRPDKFPPKVQACNDWSDCFNRLSRDWKPGYRKVRGGLFYSQEHLIRYQARAIRECQNGLDL